MTVRFAIWEQITGVTGLVLLARALTNIIENALHAMPGAGSLTVRALTELRLLKRKCG